jgi:hypothetical protein
VRTHAIGVTDGTSRLLGDCDATAELHGFDPKTSTLDLAGSRVLLSNVEVTNASRETHRSRAAISLPSADLQIDEEPELDALVHLEADDARAIIGLVLHGTLPKLAAHFIQMPHLTAQSHLLVAPGMVLFSDLAAGGGDTSVRGAFGLYDGAARGAFIVQKGPVSVGIGIDKNGVRPRLRRLNRWLTAQKQEIAERGLQHQRSQRGAKAEGNGAGAPKRDEP